ncbi:MAG: MMPL family transporter [Deltaproteobacteria bacterium]|nr:MMPL family transporter [Deltaproteobacteria bacterium]
MRPSLRDTSRVLSSTVARRGGWVVFATLVLALGALLAIIDPRTLEPRLVLDPSLDSMLPVDDDGRRFYERVKSTFETGEVVLVAVVSDDVFTADVLAAIKRMTERIESLDYVHHVSSLATALNIRSHEGELIVEPFFDEVPEGAAALEDLRRRALSDPIYAGNLVSRDARASVVLVHLLDVPELELIEAGADAAIAAIAYEEAGDAEIWLTGGAHVKAEMSQLMLADIGLVIPLALLVMSGVAYISFRTVRGVVVPLATVGLSTLLTLAFVAVTYGRLNTITVAAPPVLIVVGFAYAIHVLSAYYDALRDSEVDHQTSAEAVLQALHRVGVPVVFTAITTAAGFFSLMTSPLEAIQQFGAFCGVGVMLTMLVSLTLAPSLLAILPIPARVRARRRSDRFDDLLGRLGAFDLRHRSTILTVGAAVGLFALVGMFRIELGTDTVGNFKRDNPVRVDFQRVNQQLEGANAFDVIFEAGEPDAWKDPENLAVLQAFQQWIGEQPEVGGSTSLADYVKVIHRGFQEGEGDLVLPDSRQLVSQLLIIGGNDELDAFVESDYQIARVVVRTTAMDSADVMGLVGRTEAYLSELSGVVEGLRASVTGNSVLVSRTQDDLAYGQAISLLTAFVFIFLILSLLFTSFRIGAVALVPNALPVLIYFGLLGWSGVTLNTTTGLVACLVLGIAVDDTIHLLAHFNAAAKRSLDEARGVIEAVRAVGRPVTYTTIALCLGFMTLMLSEMRSQQQFGALAAITLAAAWLVDLTFTPAIASRMRVVSLWDVLTLDLGEAPQLSIPLFAGLSHSQARITALLGSIRPYEQGDYVVRKGDSGEEMFVVIEGELTASIRSAGETVVIRKLGRGDVIGEVALFHGLRTADVQAEGPVRLLCLTHACLQRLNRRYPRIGARVHANLAVVLSNRLADVTDRYGTATTSGSRRVG